MAKSGIIYKITNLINNKVYIGQTTQSLKTRWNNHCSKGTTCKALASAIKKYGKENFQIEQILTVFNKKDLNQFETYFIKFYNSFGPKGYNLSLGGEYDGSDVLKKQVIGYNPLTNTSIILTSINGAKKIGLDPRAIQRCLKGECYLHHKYFWFYINDFNEKTLNQKIQYYHENKYKKPNTSSKYKGVSWCKQTKKWTAGIKINNKSLNLGSYDSEIDARNAYLKYYNEVYLG